jgi:Flp pilus assembly protein TadD
MREMVRRTGPARLPLLGLLAGLSACATGGARQTEIDAKLRVASVAEASGQPEIAVSVLSTLANASPDNSEVQARYARAMVRAGNLAEAEAVVARALQRRPGDALLLRELGQIRLLQGKPTEALQDFQAVLRAMPRDVRAATGQGVALDLLGRHDQAQTSYRTALAIEPQNLTTLNNLALSLILADRPGEAVAVLEPLAQRSDATDRIRNNLAFARRSAGMADGPAPMGAAAATALLP